MNDYTNIKKCPGCGGPIFKFVNISDDTYNLQCGYTSITISDVIKNGVTKKHVETPAKKLPCGFSHIFDKLEKGDTEYDENTLFDYEDENSLGLKYKINQRDDNDVYESESEEEDYEEEGYGNEEEEEELEEEEDLSDLEIDD